ncbi:MAG: KH domain-containing protein [Verrucomicrobiota bacterium]|nr:KH domain-containing protein [Verrucomicrobiota bacterium]
MPVDARALTEEFVKLLGFEATVTEQHIQDGVLIDIQCDDPGRLIGRQGQTLSQLQYLINRMIYQKDPTASKVTLDVGNYRANAREALITKAKEAAEKVRRWGDIVELEPMNAFDRRIVHNTLKDDPTVETHSVAVEGTTKKAILLRPKR